MLSKKQPPLDALNDIKQMMEKSSRFISLSGWSGISAGSCALIGATFAYKVLNGGDKIIDIRSGVIYNTYLIPGNSISQRLFAVAILTFVAAFISAFIFTYIRSRKTNTPIWGATARRLIINVATPMIAGGVYLLHLTANGIYGLIAPGCLIFYGLALINGSKYTVSEIRYLGYLEIILGLISCWFIGWGLYFWAVGFGVLHIIYGAVMLNKYERNN